nr:GNAT family N-acetyltransferase [Ferroglobus placidus]
MFVTSYTPEEKGNLVRFYESFDQERRCCGLPPMKREAIEKWLEELNEKGYGFISKKGEEIIGHIAVVPKNSEAEFVVFIHRNYEDRGIGKKLIEFAEKFLKEMGIKKLVAVTEATNRRAIITYSHLGFSVVGRDSFYIYFEKIIDFS